MEKFLPSAQSHWGLRALPQASAHTCKIQIRPIWYHFNPLQASSLILAPMPHGHTIAAPLMEQRVFTHLQVSRDPAVGGLNQNGPDNLHGTCPSTRDRQTTSPRVGTSSQDQRFKGNDAVQVMGTQPTPCAELSLGPSTGRV